MFDALTDRLTSVFDRLSGRGVLSEKDIDEALKEVRTALLDADVALPVVRDFIARPREQATGEAVIRSVRPADQVVKITYDGLVEMLGGEGAEGLNLSLNPPTVILMAGLQASGKTTTAAKLALPLSRERKKVLLAPLDHRDGLVDIVGKAEVLKLQRTLHPIGVDVHQRWTTPQWRMHSSDHEGGARDRPPHSHSVGQSLHPRGLSGTERTSQNNDVSSPNQ